MRRLNTASGGEGEEMFNQRWLAEISAVVEHAQQLYYRLIIVLGPASVGAAITEHLGMKRVNVSMDLGERLLNLPTWQRPLRVGRLLKDLVEETAEEVVFLDHLEILFEPSLKQDPLRLLQGLSRDRIVIAVWSGVREDGSLIYAVPGHPEYRRYPAAGLLLVDAENSGGS